MGFASQRHSLPGPSHPPVAIKSNYNLIITITGSLPSATTGTPYSVSLSSVLSISGGLPPFTWTVISGALPSGLSMDTSGNIAGTPTTTGTYNFTVQIVDPIGNVGTLAIGVSL